MCQLLTICHTMTSPDEVARRIFSIYVRERLIYDDLSEVFFHKEFETSYLSFSVTSILILDALVIKKCERKSDKNITSPFPSPLESFAIDAFR